MPKQAFSSGFGLRPNKSVTPDPGKTSKYSVSSSTVQVEKSVGLKV